MSGMGRAEGGTLSRGRRRLCAALCVAAAAALTACAGAIPSFSAPRRRRAVGRAAAGRHARRGPGSRRPDPAAVGAGQCRRRRAVHEKRRRHGARRIQESEHPIAGEGRRRHAAGRASRRATGDRRRRRDHHRPAVRGSRQRRRFARAHARHPGDRVFDRRQRRRPRRLSVELPAGDRRQAHRRLRHLQAASVRSPRCCPTAPMARWWKPRSSRRCRGAAAASWRWRNIRSIRTRWPSRRGAWRRRPPRSTAIFIPDGADAVPQVVQALAASGRESQARAIARHRPVGRSARVLNACARRRLVRGAGVERLPQFLRPLPRPLRAGSGAHGDARL